MKRRTIAAACLPIILVDIFFAIVYSNISVCGKTCSYGSYNGQNRKSNNTSVRIIFVLAHQRSTSGRLVCVCVWVGGWVCVVFRDFSAKFREMISEVGKLNTNLRRPALDSCCT